ncbi:hypothetical protein GCM10010401_18540 [Rarobacter faecitabidus]|uniref:Sulfotransferase family protein n=1 Tax=Rarobacter faecitabidus TaxID=13243 RepID=A0A542ZUN3_RARFA|nr:hypothetical protein [Rarobacter faecitabidus]TQL64064.1 hypothetical protein FB461_0549 [Rarobacter faecitabidus]
MSAPETTDPASAIPVGGTLLHVGMPKSGTTAIQFAAAKLRKELTEFSVIYPGKSHNHSLASFAIAKRRRGWGTGAGKAAIPPMSHWHDLVAEARAAKESDRVLISHEFFAERTEAICRTIANDLGPNLSVVFTLRNQPSILPSAWQEYLKTGIEESFEEWLDVVLRPGPDSKAFPSFARRIALYENIAKWSEIVGPDNTHVIVLDRTNRSLLHRSFEQLLGLPADTLDVELTGREENRSLTRPEADAVRAVNERLKQVSDIRWDEFRDLHKFGGIAELLVERKVPSGEPPIVAPRWAAQHMSVRAEQQAAQIQALGVHVIGDLANLSSMPPALPEATSPCAEVNVAIAAHLETGSFKAGQRYMKAARAAKSSGGEELVRHALTAGHKSTTDAERIKAAAALTATVPTRVLIKIATKRVARILKAKLRRR